MPALPPAILFDLDDTILASGRRPEVLLQLAHEFADRLGGRDPDALAEGLEATFAEFWSDPARHKAARVDIAAARRGIVAQHFAGENLSADLAHAFADRFIATREALTALFPGARETLEGLRARGVRLALVTNGAADTQRDKIERFDLAPFFEHIQIEGEHGFGKPEDRAYQHALATLGVAPAQAWMVGDHLEWEVAAPQRHGIHAVWCDPYGLGLPPDSPIRPDRTIRSLPELLD